MDEYGKICMVCNNEFNRSLKKCPNCLSDNWRWIDATGRLRNFYEEALLKRMIRDARLRRIKKMEARTVVLDPGPVLIFDNPHNLFFP